MTTPRQLMDLAGKHEQNPCVKALLVSLKEGQSQANTFLTYTESRVKSLQQGARMEDFYRISMDNSGLVSEAARAAAALTRMAYDLVNLASVLESLGEEISY